MSINWRQIAEENGLSMKEFESEIFTAAATPGAMKIDERSISEN